VKVELKVAAGSYRGPFLSARGRSGRRPGHGFWYERLLAGDPHVRRGM